MSRPARRFVPRLQAFDERCLPSVSAVIVPGTTGVLQITGDANANTITITDDGTANGVTVVGDGQTFTFANTITAIIVDAGAGDDVVTYTLNSPVPQAWSRNIDVNLGTGNDTFTANMNGQELAPSVSLDISAYGQGGKDNLTLNAQNFNTDMNSILNVDFVGGAGKNSINFNYTPGNLVDGSVILQITKK
jgi:hypothetical protein